MSDGILLLVSQLGQGGSERQVTETALGLDRQRFSPSVGCFDGGGIRGDDLRAAGVPVVEFRARSFKSAAAIQAGIELARYVRRNHIRLVHAFDVPMTVFGVPITKFLTGAAAVASARAHRELAPPRYIRILRVTDRLADRIVVNCQFIRQHLIQEGVKEPLIHVCYNGVDVEKFRPASVARPAALGSDSLVIGVVCVLRPEKGLPTLIDAFARVRRGRPGLKLAIIGSGSMLKALEAQAAELGVFADCVFQPETTEVANWYRAIDIFVLPSVSEALSNSLMEAMASGCCAVASNVGGNPELVDGRASGLLFAPGNVEDLAAQLTTLIESETLRKQLAANGRALIHGRFTRAASAVRMSEIYSSVLG